MAEVRLIGHVLGTKHSEGNLKAHYGKANEDIEI